MYIFSNTIYALIRKQISYSFYNFDIIIGVFVNEKSAVISIHSFSSCIRKYGSSRSRKTFKLFLLYLLSIMIARCAW